MRLPLPYPVATCVLVASAACAGRYHTELVGQGTAIIQPRSEVVVAEQPDAAAPPPWTVGGGGVPLPRGSYDLAIWFDLPRAQVVDWTVTCPGVDLHGSAGEPFEQYRQRRLAALQAQYDRGAPQPATTTDAYVEPPPPPPTPTPTETVIAPRARGGARISTPFGEVTVRGDAQLRGAVTTGTSTEPTGTATTGTGLTEPAPVPPADNAVALPPGDTGQGRLLHRVHIVTTDDGICAVTAAADDPQVRGSYQVLRVRDLDAEARLAVMAHSSAAIEVRSRVKARLVAHGADPLVRDRRLAAEADARAHAEAELRLSAQAELELTARADHDADRVRAALRGRYVRHGADPHLRARLQAERNASIRAQHTASRIEIEAQVRLERDLEQRRLELALQARDLLRARFVAWGAIPRPPMPDLLAEDPGDPPAPGARWTDGKWVWINGRWEWRPGYWTDPDVFTETGGDVMVDFDLGGSLGGRPAGETVRDHRDRGDKIRDHRNGTSFDGPNVRDHRDDKPPEPTVRDHRSNDRDDMPKSTIRDHRDDKKDDKKDDDRGSNVRDHRRR